MSSLLSRVSPRATAAAAAASRGFSTTAARGYQLQFRVIGRLGGQPELRTLSSGSEVVNFNVASSPRAASPEAEKTNWLHISSFVNSPGRRDFMLGLQKGALVSCDGDITVKQVQDKEGNQAIRYYFTERNIVVLSKGRQAEGDEGEGARE